MCSYKSSKTSWSLTVLVYQCVRYEYWKWDYCFIAEHKWSVNLTGPPSGTIFMMRLRNITGIPDSHQGVRHLGFPASYPPSDFEVIVCARIKSFLAFCIARFFQMVNIAFGRGFLELGCLLDKSACRKNLRVSLRDTSSVQNKPCSS